MISSKKHIESNLQVMLDRIAERGAALIYPEDISLMGVSLYHNNNRDFEERSVSILSTAFNQSADKNYIDYVRQEIHPQRIPLCGTSIGQVLTGSKRTDCSRSSYRSDQLCYNKALNKDFAVQLIFKVPHGKVDLPLTRISNQARQLISLAQTESILLGQDPQLLKGVAEDKFTQGVQLNCKNSVLASYDVSRSTQLRKELGYETWRKHLAETVKLTDYFATNFGGQIVRAEGDGAHILFTAGGYDHDNIGDMLCRCVLPFSRAVLTGYNEYIRRASEDIIRESHIRMAGSFGKTSMSEISARYGVTDYMGDVFLINRSMLNALPRDHNVIAVDDTLAQYVPEGTLLQRPTQGFTHFKPSIAYLF